MHSYFFYFFLLFYFLLFILLAGPAQPMWELGWTQLGWTQPARPGPVTGPSQWPGWAKPNRRHSWGVSMHCAKVINLPSRSAILLTKWGKEEKNESWLTCAQRSKNAMKDFGSLPSSFDFVPFTLCFRSSSLLLFLSLLYILSLVLEMAKTVANLFFFCLISGDGNWFSSLSCCFFFRSPVSSFSVFFCFFLRRCLFLSLSCRFTLPVFPQFFPQFFLFFCSWLFLPRRALSSSLAL